MTPGRRSEIVFSEGFRSGRVTRSVLLQSTSSVESSSDQSARSSSSLPKRRRFGAAPGLQSREAGLLADDGLAKLVAPRGRHPIRHLLPRHHPPCHTGDQPFLAPRAEGRERVTRGIEIDAGPAPDGPSTGSVETRTVHHRCGVPARSPSPARLEAQDTRRGRGRDPALGDSRRSLRSRVCSRPCAPRCSARAARDHRRDPRPHDRRDRARPGLLRRDPRSTQLPANPGTRHRSALVIPP